MPGTFGDFLGQVPIQLIGMMCTSGIMLVAILIFGIIRRSKDKQAKENPQPTPQEQSPSSGFNLGGLFNRTPQASTEPTTEIMQPSPVMVSDDDSDMPDLDMLLEMTDVDQAPPPQSASTPAQPEQPVYRLPGIVNVRMSTGATVEAAEMLVILRERHTDRLIVQIGDDAYSGNEADISPEFRQKFVKLMKELSTVAPKLSKGAKAKSAPTPANTTTTQPTAAPSTPPQAPTNANTKAPQTLAEHIEAFLQNKRQMTGAFAGRTIHVRNSADGGVEIEVDGQTYPSVGEVSDAEVKKFLADTIAEWQATQ